MKLQIVLACVVLALAAFSSGVRRPGPIVLECPHGTVCKTWIDDAGTYLSVTNVTDVEISGTVTLNEIYEKAFNRLNRLSVEIDGRWIEIKLPPKQGVLLSLGK